MNRTERAILTKHAATLLHLGLDVSTGKVPHDQAGRWLRILSLEVRMSKAEWIRSATWPWFEQERINLAAGRPAGWRGRKSPGASDGSLGPRRWGRAWAATNLRRTRTNPPIAIHRWKAGCWPARGCPRSVARPNP